ncbi:MAG: glycosyltransferase [Woeseiaceae bacterium]
MSEDVTQTQAERIAMFLPNLDGGGAERVFVELANEFARAGATVDLVLAAARGPYLDEVSSDVRVVDLVASRVLMAIRPLAQYVRDSKPAVISSGLEHANIVSCLATRNARKSTRCVVSIRSMPAGPLRETGSWSSRIILAAAKFAYRFADLVIANSNAVAREASSVYGISEEKIRVVYNPLDTARIGSLACESPGLPWDDSDELPFVLAVGRLDRLKDFGTLIRAFQFVRSRHHCRLVILGEGPERSKLEGLADDLGVGEDIYLVGFVGNPYPWMREAAVVVNSSITEGCPNVVLQALACGTPVVCTDSHGGSAEVLDDGKWGQLVPVGDAEAMANSIESVLRGTPFPDGRIRAQDFSSDLIAGQYLRVLLPGFRPAPEH